MPPPSQLARAFDALASRRIVFVGGKGGVGKTTIAAAAALHFARARPTILFTTDPASSLGDLFEGSEPPPALTVESVDAGTLYQQFLDRNLSSFLEIGDRGTYLDRDELRRLFELALPGIDELMAWMHIGELAVGRPEALVVVDTAPTGHTLRMLSSSRHFEQIARALDAMQAKHRAMVRQFSRREVRDALDVFIEEFDARATHYHRLMTDENSSAFIPVLLSEPWVVEQTLRLVAEVREDGLPVPFAVVNRAVLAPDCERDHAREAQDAAAAVRLAPVPVVAAGRSCTPLDSLPRIAHWWAGAAASPDDTSSHGACVSSASAPAPETPVGAALTLGARLLFVAGKGGVGKTTTASSLALQRALAEPSRRCTLISVDPAHTVRDVFANEAPPPGLTVETIDTRQKWQAFRETIGREIEAAAAALTPGNFSLEYDAEAMKQLVEIAPPGADEIFAVTRLTELIADETIDAIVVDTAPTGHFLRLLELPRTAGEWVREFMRLLLRYRQLVPAGSLGEELVRASRALKELETTLHSPATAVLVVTRPERMVVAESRRLLDALDARGIAVAGVIANAVTPRSPCLCDRQMRSFEIDALSELGVPVVVVERRDAPVIGLSDLARLIPL